MNYYVVNSNSINSNYYFSVINLRFADSVEDLKKISVKKIFKALKYSLQLLRQITFRRPDLVYYSLSIAGYAFFRDIFYVILLKLFNIKILYHLHCKGIKDYSRNKIKKRFYQLVFNNSYVICLSKDLTNDIKDVYRSTPFIIPNGIKIYEQQIQKSKNPSTKPRILFLSNYAKSKGVLILIEALSILKNSGLRFDADFVGDTADLSSEILEQIIIQKDLQSYVEIKGPLYDDDKIFQYLQSDIFVHPTNNDAFPLVVLEAMQFGLPVISTYEGGLPNIVLNNETGYLVEKNNPEALAEKISILISDKDKRRAMGKLGYDRFIENYTLNHFEHNIMKIFNTILS